ncbi:MAG: hypothetical protein QOE41_4139 [Mycobacterium sp.]|nr:hypothetical protein [Mycobacterium sp.]
MASRLSRPAKPPPYGNGDQTGNRPEIEQSATPVPTNSVSVAVVVTGVLVLLLAYFLGTRVCNRKHHLP